MVVALIFRKLLPGSNKISVPLGAALIETSSKRDETILAGLCSDHTQAQTHVVAVKVYPLCLDCNVTQATPVHILACISYHKSQLLLSHATVLHC
ncbi:hypothetical protein TNCV_644671 [Trichonephila clavipes]|nr:hypothetical protein TNCV_644671 [Trichonephila clavipes]